MTIGDEKVRRYEPRMIGIEDRPHEAGMYVSLHGPYVLHSAYAEMAADRDSLRSAGLYTANRLAEAESQLAEERELRMSLESSWQQAEAQLAELRGKCEALSTDISEAVEDVARSGGYINSDEAKGWSVELRTLAAADGGVMDSWHPIDSAPTDGRPVWVRGWDWGKRDTRHYCWAYWHEAEWRAAGADGATLQYLDEWMPGATK